MQKIYQWCIANVHLTFPQLQTGGSGAIPREDWKGQDAHWLKSDRENCTERWTTSCWAIIKNNLQNKFQPFSQIRDFYKWVRYETEKQGHEVRWAKGADLLVHGLSIIDELPPLLNAFALTSDLVNLLKELNLGIANFSIHKWNELLIQNKNNPIIGHTAYEWDKSFIYEEQGIIAPPIYTKYEVRFPDAIIRMNSMVHHEIIPPDDPIEDLIETIVNLVVANISGIPKFDAHVSCTDSQYRIDFPLKMLYPSTHNPVHGVLIRRGNLDFLNVPFKPILFCK